MRDELMTDEVWELLPLLTCREVVARPNPLLPVRYHMSDAHWAWYPMAILGMRAGEGSGGGNDTGGRLHNQANDILLYGYIHGDAPHLGVFTLRELEAVRGLLGRRVRRDRGWAPRRLMEVAADDILTACNWQAGDWPRHTET